jgi:hypothetical protein
MKATTVWTGLEAIGGTPIIGSPTTPHRSYYRNNEVGAEHWREDKKAGDAEEERVERDLSERAKQKLANEEHHPEVASKRLQ